MTDTLTTRYFRGYNQIRIATSAGGNPAHPGVLLLHGGGQTRHAWNATARQLVDSGYYVIAMDLRGHGDSDWAPDGDYSLAAQTGDVRAVIAAMPSAPTVIGASMGGLIALVTLGESPEPLARALVLVDVAPRIDPDGEARIVNFMQAHPEGFASVEEAAEAIAEYNPNRPRPKSNEGLKRNLRKRGERYYWHWDPKLFDTLDARAADEDRFDSAARRIEIPTLLVRGSRSDLVTEDSIKHFLEVIPHSSYVDVHDAGHMVVGDQNDAFGAALTDFLGKWGR